MVRLARIVFLFLASSASGQVADLTAKSEAQPVAVDGAIDHWIEKLGSPDETTSQEAIEWLSTLGPNAVPALSRASKNNRENVRRNAAVVLGKIGAASTPAISTLMDALNDESWSVRFASQLAIQRIQTEFYRELPTEAQQVDAELSQLMRAGKYVDAIPLAKRLCMLIDKAKGENSFFVTGALDSLGSLYQATNNLINARTCFHRILEIYDRLPNVGPNHIATAACMTKLGEVERLAGNLSEAETLHQNALRIQESFSGLRSPGVAQSLCALGNLYVASGSWEDAEKLYFRALTICKDHPNIGPQHEITADCCVGLALLYQTIESYSAAQPLYDRAERIYSDTRGSHHPATLALAARVYEVENQVARYWGKDKSRSNSGVEKENEQQGGDSRIQAILAGLIARDEEVSNRLAELALVHRVAKSRGETPWNTINLFNSNSVVGVGDTTRGTATLLVHHLTNQANEEVKKVLSSDSLDTYARMIGFVEQAKYEEALKLALEISHMVEKAKGRIDSCFVTACSNVALLFAAGGKFEEATTWSRVLFLDRDKLLGHFHPDTVEAVCTLIGVQIACSIDPPPNSPSGALGHDITNEVGAEISLDALLAIRQMTHDPRHPIHNNAWVLDRISLPVLARIDRVLQSHTQSAKLLEQENERLDRMDERSPPSDPTLLIMRNPEMTLEQFKSALASWERYEKRRLGRHDPFRTPQEKGSEVTIMRLLQRMEKVAGELDGCDDAVSGPSLAWVASFYEQVGQLPCYDPSLAQFINAAIEHNLALCLAIGQDDVAESILLRKKQSLSKSSSLATLRAAEVFENLGFIYLQRGEYQTAQGSLEQAILIRDKHLGPEHDDSATCHIYLGWVLMKSRDFKNAKVHIEQALRVLGRKIGPDIPDVALRIHEDEKQLIGYALDVIAGFKSWELREKYPNQGKDAAKLIQLRGDCQALIYALQILAEIHYQLNESNKATQILDRAFVISQKTHGAESNGMSRALVSKGNLELRLENYDAAVQSFRNALLIREKDKEEGAYATAEAANRLAIALAAQGKPAEALIRKRRAWRILQEQVANISLLATEREQLSMTELISGELNADLSLTIDHLNRDPKACAFAFEVVLAQKGSILDSLLARQLFAVRGANPVIARLMHDCRTTAQAWTDATLRASMPSTTVSVSDVRNHLAKLRICKIEADEALARASGRIARYRQVRRAGPKEIAPMLGSDSALVEFIRYHSLDFKAKRDDDLLGEAKYAAVVARSTPTAPALHVALAPLGSAKRIEDAVGKWRTIVGPNTSRRIAKREEIDAAGKDLARLIWYPVAQELGNIRKLYISTDGELAFVSFAALPFSGDDTNKFVIDEYDIAYVGTGRDLVRRQTCDGGQAVLIGDPDYGPIEPTGSIATMRATPGFASIKFRPLSGTRDEVNAISRLLSKHGERPLHLTGTEATEAALKSARHPRVLHLATHGFFLPDVGIEDMINDVELRGVGGTRPIQPVTAGSSPGESLRRKLEIKNPMHRSGVALAGANNTVQGRRNAGGDDGILTAEEVAGMDLFGTQLVVISACESGLGEAKCGEGVFGLRRAFTMAGAENVVMTLWSVPDKPTQELMCSFYENLDKTGSPPQALLVAQRAWIAKERKAGRYPQPFNWAAFVASGCGNSLANQ